MAASVGDRTATSERRVVATIVARNYVPYARVLADSVGSSNPGLERVTLLVDGSEADREITGIGTVLLPADLGLAPDELEPMTVMYTVMELSTALKPALLRHLLRGGYQVAAYLDPDIFVTGDLGPALDAAHEHAIALTPHVLGPVPHDGLEIAERTVMQAGVFNLGFIAVGAGAGDFLDWWHTRLTTHAVVDFSAGLFTDQRWVDWVPALFPHTVLRDRGLNVAYWNAHERPLTVDGDGRYFASGEPLVFMHFSGFQPDRPWMLSRFTGRTPRVLVSESPALARLCAEYGATLEAAGYREARGAEYGFGRLDDGTPLTPEMRTAYRGALLGDLPFEEPPVLPLTTPGALREWFERPARLTPWYRLTPAQYARWLADPELQACDPYPLTHSLAELRAHLAAPAGEWWWALEGATQAPVGEVPPGDGWTVLAGGSHEPAGEVVELAARLADALAAAGEQVDLVGVATRPGAAAVRWDSLRPAPGVGCPNVLVCVDANRILETELAPQLEGSPGLRVAVWLTSDAAEVAAHERYLEAFDEVWCVSPAIEGALRSTVSIPVARIDAPLGMLASAPPRAGDAGLRFLLELDAGAPLARQRVDTVIGAYLASYGADEGHELLVRPRYGRLAPADVELVRHLAEGRRDVHLADGSGPTSADGVDVLLALNPLLDTGLSAADAHASGRTVVTGAPGVSALVGVDERVVRVPAAAGRHPSLDEVTLALAGLPATVAAGSGAGAPPAVGGSPDALLRAAASRGRRADRRELRHRDGLEQEVLRLRTINAHHLEQRAALEETKIFRYTRVMRRVYRGLRGLVR